MQLFTVILIICIIAAVCASSMARRRNRDHNLWVFLSFLFPPFIMWLWLLSKQERPPHKLFAEEQQSEEFRPFKD